MVITFLQFANYNTLKYLNLCIIFMHSLTFPITFLDLLTVKSAEENDFIVTYSPSVWKAKMSVWLGMFYDSDGKFDFHPKTCLFLKT